jgi:hypothetical protein
MPENMSLSAFAKRHSVARKTATRLRQAGYVVPATGPVDVERSEKLLAERPAESQGGHAKGPTAESRTVLAEHIARYQQFRDAHARAVAVYDCILEELRAVPPGSAEIELHHSIRSSRRAGRGVQATM